VCTKQTLLLVRGGEYAGYVEPVPVVFQDEADELPASLEEHAHSGRTGVFQHVGQPLLHNAVDCGLHFRREPLSIQADALHVRLDAVPRGPVVQQGFQRGPQPQAVQPSRAQVQCKPLHFACDLAGQLLEFLDSRRLLAGDRFAFEALQS
jgi:hypothetical protein